MNSNSTQRSDFLAVFLSFLAGIAQLLLFIAGSLSQMSNFQRIFVSSELIPIAVLTSLLGALCLVGVISFIKKNPDFSQKTQTFRPFIYVIEKLFIPLPTATLPNAITKREDKRNLIFAVILLFVSIVLFLISTTAHLITGSILFISRSNVGVWQILSFMSIWTLSPVILYVWISNEIEKYYQFKPENFIPNLIRSLQNQGFITINIKDDVIVQNTFHLVRILLLGEEKYFIVQYDGKRIEKELSRDEYDSVKRSLNPQSS